MTDRDAFADRERALEEEYFRKKDRELIERMRQAAEAERKRAELSRATGLSDLDVLRDLQELGFTPDTVALLPLVPVIQVAWLEGGVTSAERRAVEDLARHRGIAPGSPADRQLADWLETRPPDAVFARAARLISAMLNSGAVQTHDLTADDLVKYCERIAAASGGIFGLGLGSVSPEERELLGRIASELKGRR